MRALLVTPEMILPAKRLGTSKHITHHIFLLEVYGSFVSTQICCEAGTKKAACYLTGVFLFVYGTDVFTAEINTCSKDSQCSVTYRWALSLMETLVQSYSWQVTPSVNVSVLGLVSSGDVCDGTVTLTNAKTKMQPGPKGKKHRIDLKGRCHSSYPWNQARKARFLCPSMIVQIGNLSCRTEAMYTFQVAVMGRWVLPYLRSEAGRDTYKLTIQECDRWNPNSVAAETGVKSFPFDCLH